MRVTLSIDDDVFAAAKKMAAEQRRSIGQVISTLARQSLRSSSTKWRTRNGVPLLVARPGGEPVTAELVRRWMNGAQYQVQL